MLTGTYLATRASVGAIISVGRSMRAINDAMIRFRSSLLLSRSSRASLGRVFLARFAPRTTRIRGTATWPFWLIAIVTELRTKPSVKKTRCNAGTDATIMDVSMAQSGGFMKSHTPWRNRQAQREREDRVFCIGVGRPLNAAEVFCSQYCEARWWDFRTECFHRLARLRSANLSWGIACMSGKESMLSVFWCGRWLWGRVQVDGVRSPPPSSSADSLEYE